VRRFAHFEPGEDARLFRRIQNMPDLDAAAIESLLLDGARRHGMTVSAYRELLRAIANRTKAPFGKTLQVIENFETSYPRDHQAVVEQIEQLAFLREGAARLGVSVRKFLMILFGDDEGKLPARH